VASARLIATSRESVGSEHLVLYLLCSVWSHRNCFEPSRQDSGRQPKGLEPIQSGKKHFPVNRLCSGEVAHLLGPRSLYEPETRCYRFAMNCFHGVAGRVSVAECP
jgi:hypothetical protein